MEQSCPTNATICSGTSCLQPVDNFNYILNIALSTVITTLLALVMFSLGCSVEFQKFWGHIRHPWGIVVGFLCQFGIMPLAGFVLSLAFNILPIQAVVVLIMGCCPGGTGSNILTYWIDGDMDLSLSMTTCSTLLALGMMPLCLFLYTKKWVDSSAIIIPYDSIGISLATLVVPVAVGMFVNYKWPEKAKKILKMSHSGSRNRDAKHSALFHYCTALIYTRTAWSYFYIPTYLQYFPTSDSNYTFNSLQNIFKDLW
ncbi:hypothetical protein XENTR_v10006409 [Xenopus tropicalis]|nr:hypothetical protein XENTR_v10006409 [Xenopus tropicalis]